MPPPPPVLETDRLILRAPATEDFELQIPAKAMEELKGKRLQEVQLRLIDWITATAPTLPIANVGRYAITSKVSIPGVPFYVKLHRSRLVGQRSGMFQVVHVVSSSNAEEQRLQRIRKAYSAKAAKLAAWKHNAGARSILILEDSDLQLTNQHLVADALAKVEANADEKPDEIYLVVTAVDEVWWIWALRIDSEGFDALAQSQRST